MARKWWTLVAVCIATFMLLIDVTIVNVALPNIQASLHASFTDVQWVVDAYSLMLAALLLTAGSLADLFGRRRVFSVGLSVFTASSLLSGLATTPLFLNLARAAQGVGGAMLFATSLALLAQTFRGRERGTAFGAWGAITGLAVAIGPVIGGALTSALSWRWIFLVNVPIGIGAVILTLAHVQESREHSARRPDFIGLVTFSGALGAIVYALIKAGSLGWASTTIVACLAGGGALLIVFLVAEAVQSAPMFDLSLFRKPTFLGGSIAAFALSAGLFSLLLYITLYLQDILGYSPLQAGLRLLVISGGILLTSTLAGRLTAHVPIRLLIGPGLALVAIGILLMRGIDATTGWTHLIPGFILAGAGTGLINPPLASTAIGVVEPKDAGMASGINTTFRQVGIATGVAALGSIFAHQVRTKILAGLSSAPGIGTETAHRIATSVSQGDPTAVLGRVPRSALHHATTVVRSSFVQGLNDIFLIGAVLAAVAAVLSLALIRNKDFAAGAAHDAGGGKAVPPPPAGSQSDNGRAATGTTSIDDYGAEEEVRASDREGVEAAARVAHRAGVEEEVHASDREGVEAAARVAHREGVEEEVHASDREGVDLGVGAADRDGVEAGVGAADRDGVEAVLRATDEALDDLRRRVGQVIEEHRDAQLAAAEAQARELRAQALAESKRYAERLLQRLEELAAASARHRSELRAQVKAERRAVTARTELYRLIGEIGALAGAPGEDGGRGADGDGADAGPRAPDAAGQSPAPDR